jgi:rod shape-determining protein MreD
MHILIILILIYLLLLIQAQMGFAFRPDLMLVAVIVLSLKRKPSGALGYGFLCGFLQDALLSTAFFNTLSKTLSAVLSNYLKAFLVFDRRTSALILTLLLSPLAVFMNALSANIFRGIPIQFLSVLLSALVVTLLNLLFVPVILFIFDRFVGD